MPAQQKVHEAMPAVPEAMAMPARTVFSARNAPNAHGYEPQKAPKTMIGVKKLHIQLNSASDSDAFRLKFGQELPKWWPRHADGHHWTHLWRLIDDDWGTDIAFPQLLPPLSDKVKENTKVDFQDADVKRQVIRHIDKCSEGKTYDRPFLSTSSDIICLQAFAASKVEHLRKNMAMRLISNLCDWT